MEGQDFMLKEMLDIDYEYDIVLKKFLLSYYDGAKEFNKRVMKEYVITLLESKLVSSKMFLIILNEVFEDIKTLFIDIPFFLPGLVYILKDAQDKKLLDFKEIANVTKPLNPDDWDYMDFYEAFMKEAKKVGLI